MQEVKSRLLQSFVVLSIFVYCALIAAVALKSPSGGTDLKTQLDFIQVAGRLLPADLMNPR